ncbi:hypothetical protein PanWU01x14_179660 [Parasponia andersonii]|uniref:Uncharacterized protein n=1 Tax=Parasponia andersonii TaxID=3476 RepID=A0A2P5C6T9_PARAD|nr:hypothetical protein PanWU01x14_179660 [Parasponia andersonii]
MMKKMKKLDWIGLEKTLMEEAVEEGASLSNSVDRDKASRSNKSRAEEQRYSVAEAHRTVGNVLTDPNRTKTKGNGLMTRFKF